MASGLVTRNGHLPQREIGLVPLKFVSLGFGIVTESGSPVRFCPRFMRRTPSIDALIPALYLKGSRPGISLNLGSDPGLKAERSFVG